MHPLDRNRKASIQVETTFRRLCFLGYLNSFPRSVVNPDANRSRRAGLIAAGLVVVFAWPALCQQPVRAGVAGVLSPTVFATCYASTEGGNPREIVLLILWRGSPGWTTHEIQGNSAPFDVNRPELRAAHRHLLESEYRIGDVAFTFSFDPETRRIRVGNHDLDLGENNVVLVDSVDTPDALRMVGTLHLEPVLSDPELMRDAGDRSVLDLRALVNRSAPLREFLAGAPWG